MYPNEWYNQLNGKSNFRTDCILIKSHKKFKENNECVIGNFSYKRLLRHGQPRDLITENALQKFGSREDSQPNTSGQSHARTELEI